MTVETTTSFDIATFKRAYESWDVQACSSCTQTSSS
jgi:hypothetical protein